MMSKRFSAGQIALYECLIHDDNLGRIGGISSAKVAALQDGCTHDMKEILTDRVPAHDAVCYFFMGLAAIHNRNRVVAAAGARTDLNQGGGLDSRENSQPVHQPLVEANHLGITMQTLGRGYPKHEKALRAKS